MSRNKIDMETIVGFIGFVVGIGGLGYACATHTKLSKISERLDRSIDELSEDMEVDIPEDLVHAAVEKAVADQSKKAVDGVMNNALRELKEDIRTKVTAAVEKEYDNLQDSVLKEITNSASKINVARVQKEVEAKAQKAVMEKLDDNLDDILEKFNANLENTSKIYSSIMHSVRRSADNDIHLRLY